MAKNTDKKLDFKEIFRIGGVLCIICASVALILSFVNMITLEKIAENEEMEKRNAIIALFGSENVEYSTLEDAPETVNDIYNVTEGGSALGYCVSLAPSGFGGGISLMVAVDSEGKVVGTRIVSHSETPGLGSRIENESFLSQFVGANSASSDYDIISGSTISSKAVVAGVNTALEALSGVLGGGMSN